MSFRFLIVGAGFSGSVLARELAEKLDCNIEIWEKRNHLAGNCFTSPDLETGIMIHRYGPHIFNTDKKEIWEYYNRYSPLRPYVHRVKAYHNGKVYPLPINLSTLNQYFNKTFTPQTARQFLASLEEHSIYKPSNFEEQSLRSIGKELYYAFFYGYTKKQWGCEPKELPASILKRLPVRFDYNDNYHTNQYTGIPVKGYTDFVMNLLDHPRIKVLLNKEFNRLESNASEFDHVFYTGPIDTYFHYESGELGYRSLKFEMEIYNGDYQGCTQINYCDENVPYTRITEHKYFTPWLTFDKTVIFKECSEEAKAGDTLYYPKRLKKDKMIFETYREKAENLGEVSFLGRLGTYRYLDMQHVISEAIDLADNFSRSLLAGIPPPIFPDTISNYKK